MQRIGKERQRGRECDVAKHEIMPVVNGLGGSPLPLKAISPHPNQVVWALLC